MRTVTFLGRSSSFAGGDPDPRREKHKEIDIVGLKRFAQKLPATSVLRSVIAEEPDKMSAEDLVAKIPTWLGVLQHDTGIR